METAQMNALARIAFENAFDHMIITDVHGSILDVNSAAETLTGYTREEMIGQTPRLWGGLMEYQYYQKMWHTIKVLKLPFIGVLTNHHRNGTRYEAEIRIKPVLDTNGEAIYFIGIERELTHGKNA